MPTISTFYGILIRMFFNDHAPPHFHARYGEFEATIDIGTSQVLQGELPSRALQLVQEWAIILEKSCSTIGSSAERTRNPQRSSHCRDRSCLMYWDVVEVKPEPDYRLYVRFKDGLAGRVQLPREKLTGVLAPLLDVQFFEQVFIDNGAVSWPGEIDLAPDAMYAQIARRRQGPQQPPEINGESDLRRKLHKLYELKDLLVDPSHSDAYFQEFEELLKDPIPFQNFILWEKELESLDLVAWESLKAKAAPYLVCRDKKFRGWQQLFDVLGEASAYNYLKELVGCSNAWFIPESDDQTPDLEGRDDGRRILCEVKTINISDDEARARRGPTVARDVSNQLSEGFFRKLDSDIAKAKRQLQSYAPDTVAQHLVYINICFDDWVGFYRQDYIHQISQHLLSAPPKIKVVARAGPSKAETHVVAQQ